MEEILASIKQVIAEDKEARAAEPAADPVEQDNEDDEEDVLELNEELAPPGRPRSAPARGDRRRRQPQRIRPAEHGRRVRARAPPQANPLEEMMREMLRPILKQWLDDHLPRLVDEHVKREITRITGRPALTLLAPRGGFATPPT